MSSPSPRVGVDRADLKLPNQGDNTPIKTVVTRLLAERDQISLKPSLIFVAMCPKMMTQAI